MGSRAGYVVKRDGVATAYGSHWGASSIMDAIFWGPDYATRILTSQQTLDSLDEIDGGDEGTVLIDWDARRLLWWASDCELPAHQRLFNRLAASNWPGWQIDTAHGLQGEVLKYLGIEVQEEDEEGSEEDEEEEEEEEDEEEDEEEEDFEDEDVEEEEDEDEGNSGSYTKPVMPAPPVRDLDELETGCWLTVRHADGKLDDYFVVGFREDDMLASDSSLLETLPREQALHHPVPELLALSGLYVDMPAATVWRWPGPRYAWFERRLQHQWPGFQFRDLAGGWEAQMEATGRSPEGLQVNDRDILGPVVAGLLVDSSIDPRKALLGIANSARAVRGGCAAVTVLTALMVAVLALWLESVVLAVLGAVFVLLCLAATVGIWRRTAIVVKTFGAIPEGDPFEKGMTVAEKRPILSRALVAAGFPSLEALEAAGELPTGWEDDEEDEEDEEDEK